MSTIFCYIGFAKLNTFLLEELIDNLSFIDRGNCFINCGWFEEVLMHSVLSFGCFFLWLINVICQIKSNISNIQCFKVGFDFNFKTNFFWWFNCTFPSIVNFFPIYISFTHISLLSQYKPASSFGTIKAIFNKT